MCPTSLSQFDHHTIGKEYKLWNSNAVFSSLCYFLVSNIILNALFSCAFSLCTFYNVRDQVSYVYKTMNRIKFCVF
jgi:hypothetical protein